MPFFNGEKTAGTGAVCSICFNVHSMNLTFEEKTVPAFGTPTFLESQQTKGVDC